MKRCSVNPSNVKPRPVVAVLCVAFACLSACSDREGGVSVPATPVASTPTLKEIIQPVATSQPAEEKTSKARAGEWYPAGDRDQIDLDYNMTNQDGEAIKLGDVANRPMALSFLFTRCGNQQMCPLIAITMAHLQRDLEAAGLTDKTRVALMTYDPVYDTPERLKKYGADRGIRFNNGVMLRPTVEEYSDLVKELMFYIAPLPDGTFDHRMELILLDHKGQFVREYRGAIWDNAAVLADLRKLADEQAQASK